MNKTSFGERFRYWFDGVMSRGTGALIGLLALATLVFIVVVALIVQFFQVLSPSKHDGQVGDFPELLWGNLMRAMDAGTVAGDAGWWFRLPMLLVTLFGILTVATLIGIVSTAFNTKVEDLRKGRSRVIESDHTLILGWSPKVFPIISELVIANESRKKSTIVLLADGDKVEMEDAIRAQLPDTGKTKIIVRSGDPMNLRDLEVANPHTARSIIILAPDGGTDPDSIVIKTALAITNNPARKSDDYHIVGEVQEPTNMEAAKLVGRNEAHWVLASDLISRITVQSCRQSGLSVVYTELLDFDGDEVYFTTQPELVGKTYFDAQLAFSDSSVFGLVKGGAVYLNPAAGTLVQAGDELIVIAEDDSTIRMASPGAPDDTAISDLPDDDDLPERTLVLGYNPSLLAMLRELSEYVAPGSSVSVLADVDDPGLPEYPGMPITFTRGDATSRAVLDSLDIDTFDHIIVLAYSEAKSGVEFNIVSEMLDDRNRELAEVTKADDFIVSDKLISLMLSQVSENQQLTEVFDTLFSSRGSEIYLRPVERYIRPGADVDFYTVLEAARRRGETAIGYRIAEHSRVAARDYGVIVNPKKAEKRRFAPGDKIIVLAED
jgi:voltage-gated potassium channel Kch